MTDADIQRFAEGAVLLSVVTHRIGNRKALADEEYSTAGNASKAMTSASKKLFPESKTLRAVNSHLNQTKKWIEARSVSALMKGGMFFVKSEAMVEIDEYLRKREEEVRPLIEAFVDEMPSLIATAKEKLGDELSSNIRWPDPDDVRKVDRLVWNWLAFDTPENLKGISREMYDREREKAALVIQEARDNAVALLGTEMKKLVDHMVERLTPGADGKPKTFKGATVENLVSFLERFDMRNLGESAELDEMVRKAKAMLEGVDVKMIRKEEGVRNAVAVGFSKVAAELDKVVIERPKRQIDFDDED